MAFLRAKLVIGLLALCAADDPTLEIGGSQITGTSSGQLKLSDTTIRIGDSTLVMNSRGSCHGDFGDLIINQQASDKLIRFNNQDCKTWMAIKSNGNVGIGDNAAAPGTTLEISKDSGPNLALVRTGNDAFKNRLYFETDGTKAIVRSSGDTVTGDVTGNDRLVLQTAGNNDRLTIDSTGTTYVHGNLQALAGLSVMPGKGSSSSSSFAKMKIGNMWLHTLTWGAKGNEALNFIVFPEAQTQYYQYYHMPDVHFSFHITNGCDCNYFLKGTFSGHTKYAASFKAYMDESGGAGTATAGKLAYSARVAQPGSVEATAWGWPNGGAYLFLEKLAGSSASGGTGSLTVWSLVPLTFTRDVSY